MIIEVARWLRVLGVVGILFAVLLGTGCQRSPPAKRAFYYWRTTFSLSEGERKTLSEHRVDRIYLRLFDVALGRASGHVQPVGRLAFAEPIPTGIEVVPVVYVANSVFEHGAIAAELAHQCARARLRPSRSSCALNASTRRCRG